MVRFSNSITTFICILLLAALGTPEAFARWPAVAALTRQKDDKAKAKKEKKKKKRERKAESGKDGRTAADGVEKSAVNGSANGSASASETVEVVADKQSKTGDLFVYEGYVNATLGEMRLQADRVTFNNATGDMVAEGNVIFDEGADQRVTARRAEINMTSRRGTFWETTGFTNRTQTGDYLFFTAERIEKTGPETYELINASITACEDVVPKWRFSAKRAELKMDDRVKLYSSVFHVKSIPAFLLPYAWIPATRTERKSGFLIPTTGTSNQKGRTLKFAYYQTLGQSADITFRSDTYTARGLGMGAEFRAQTDERSFIRLGVFTVKDRLFGEAGENQGGTAFVGEAVQYLPRGWLAVGNVSLVTSLRFRQVFSDDISQVVDPRRESTFYVNNNTGNFSFNFLAANQTTTLFRPNPDPADTPGDGTNVDIKVRQAPEVSLTVYPRRIVDRLPIYFSLDSAVGSLKREETVEDNTVLVTPAAVQRFDFQPKLTIPLATIGGIAVTPSVAVRETFYTSSIDPAVPVFDPALFALTPADPRLDPSRPEFKPALKLFDRGTLDPVIPDNLSRRYAELTVDIRPPALEKEFLDETGATRFKHVIEPYVTYRLIGGIGDEFDQIIRFDERDAVANTNEFEYAVVNRFFTRRSPSELRRRRSRRQADDGPSEMEPVQPGKDERRKRNRGSRRGKDITQGEDRAAEDQAQPSEKPTTAPVEPKPQEPATEKPAPEKAEPAPGAGEAAGAKTKLEAGRQAELSKDQKDRATQTAPKEPGEDNAPDNDEDQADQAATNKSAPVQAYEFLSIKVAQKYFFDRDFGGALEEGRRNQFYPINTLSGFNFGGRARGVSPVNVQVHYRPLSAVYADLRMDVGSDDKAVRNLTVSGGVTTDKVSLSASWYLSRQIDLAANRFEPGTFPGNQIVTTLQLGDETRGLYGGTRIGYDFTNRVITEEKISTGRLRNSRSYLGYQWDCCGVQFNYNTFKAGLRNESAFSFSFTLAGLGSFGTDQFSQLGGGRGGRGRGRRARRDRYDDGL